MGKKAKKSLKILKASKEQKKLGKTLTIGELRRDYVMPELVANDRKRSTLSGLERDTKRFEEWWKSLSGKRLRIKNISRKHLEMFRAWMAEQGHSVPARNSCCRAVMQCLNTAERYGMIKRAPKLEAISYRGVAPKVYPSDDEICRLWESCRVATWPSRDIDLDALRYPAGTAWRIAILLYRTYGFRTQELVQLEKGFDSLEWENIFPSGLTPNPEGRTSCDRGWISYVPQKQKRLKPEPLVVPITMQARAAFDFLIDRRKDSNAQVLAWAMSGVSFRKQWKQICEVAKVFPRAGCGVDKYDINHFRKGATSAINNHRPGLAPYIIGHAEDRSGRGSIVSSKHYNNPEEAVLECMETLPMPECFNEMCTV